MEAFALQIADYDCGPTALRGALQLFGRKVGHGRLTRLAGTTSAKGTPAAGLKRALDHLGVAYREYSSKSRLLAWKWARRQTSPAVLSFDDDEHWVLLCAGMGRTVLIFDPEIGVQVYTRKDFLNRWQTSAGHIYALQLVRA